MKKLLFILLLLMTKLTFANGTSPIDLGGVVIQPHETTSIPLFDGRLDKRYLYDVKCRIYVNNNTSIKVYVNESKKEKIKMKLNGNKIHDLGLLHTGDNKFALLKICNHSRYMQISNNDNFSNININDCVAYPYWHP